MIYFIDHESKVFGGWFFEDIIWNTWNFLYKSQEDYYDPKLVKFQIESLNLDEGDSINFENYLKGEIE